MLGLEPVFSFQNLIHHSLQTSHQPVRHPPDFLLAFLIAIVTCTIMSCLFEVWRRRSSTRRRRRLVYSCGYWLISVPTTVFLSILIWVRTSSVELSRMMRFCAVSPTSNLTISKCVVPPNSWRRIGIVVTFTLPVQGVSPKCQCELLIITNAGKGNQAPSLQAHWVHFELSVRLRMEREKCMSRNFRPGLNDQRQNRKWGWH